MKDALGHGSNPRGTHSEGIAKIPRKPKAVSELPRAALLKAIEKADAEHSAVISELIAAGHGHTKPQDIIAMNTPLSQRYNATRQKSSALYDEREARKRYQGTEHPIKRRVY